MKAQIIDQSRNKGFTLEGLKRLAEIIKTARGDRSLKAFERATGVSYMVIDRIEKCLVQPKLETLMKLAPYTPHTYSELLVIALGEESPHEREIRSLQEKVEKLKPLSYDQDVAELLGKWQLQITQLQEQASLVCN